MRIYLAQLEHAWHGFARTNTLIFERGDGGNVVGEQDARMLRGPFQNAWVVGARGVDVLNAD